MITMVSVAPEMDVELDVAQPARAGSKAAMMSAAFGPGAHRRSGGAGCTACARSAGVADRAVPHAVIDACPADHGWTASPTDPASKASIRIPLRVRSYRADHVTLADPCSRRSGAPARDQHGVQRAAACAARVARSGGRAFRWTSTPPTWCRPERGRPRRGEVIMIFAEAVRGRTAASSASRPARVRWRARLGVPINVCDDHRSRHGPGRLVALPRPGA